MKKIPTLFQRDRKTHFVTDVVTPGCEWVLAGEGVATRKWDGTCVLVRDQIIYKRREVKPGQPTPDGFALEARDDVTGKSFGWMLVHPEDLNDRWIVEACQNTEPHPFHADGTYEAIGPKINGNPEGFEQHELRKHGDVVVRDWIGRSFDDIGRALSRLSWEGVVFYQGDGRMAKIKKRDYPQVADGT